MKANEFFKAMGLKAVKQFLENDNIRTKEMHDDLKRLVESHELIEQYNGLFEAKELIRVSPKLTSELRGLAAAIADVERCK